MERLREQLEKLVADEGVTALREETLFEGGELIAPPAGYYDVDGKALATGRDGSRVAVLDNAASQANRVEAGLKGIAEKIGITVLRVGARDESGTPAPIAQIAGRDTSLDWPHRQADAHWRLLEAAAVEQGVLSAEQAAGVRAATIYTAQPLLTWFPASLLFGWWNNPVDTEVLKAAKGKDKQVAGEVIEGIVTSIEAAAASPYAGVASLSRASRVLTSTIVATDVTPVHRRGSRLDPFGPLPGASKAGDEKAKSPFSVAGLGTIPPNNSTENPLLQVNGEIRGTSFLSLPLIRRYRGFDDTTSARTLLLALSLLGIHLLRRSEPGLHLRSFSDLAAKSTAISVYDAKGARPWEMDGDVDDLVALVAQLGREAGWVGERIIEPTPTYLAVAEVAATHRAER